MSRLSNNHLKIWSIRVKVSLLSFVAATVWQMSQNRIGWPTTRDKTFAFKIKFKFLDGSFWGMWHDLTTTGNKQGTESSFRNSRVVVREWAIQTFTIQTMPCWKHECLLEDWNQPSLGREINWIGDHLGTSGATDQKCWELIRKADGQQLLYRA